MSVVHIYTLLLTSYCHKVNIILLLDFYIVILKFHEELTNLKDLYRGSSIPPSAKLIHIKILGLFMRYEQTEKFFHVHAKIKAITFHIDIKEIHGLIFSHPLTCLGC